MKLKLVSVVFLFSVVSYYGCVSEKPAIPSEESKPSSNVSLRGFNFGAWGRRHWDSSLPIDEGLQFAVDEGANFLAMDWAVCFENDGHIVPGGGNLHPPFEDIESVIRKAKDLGLYVMLKPHVTMTDIGQNRNYYNTDIKIFLPSNFFLDWRNYLLSLADTAKRMNVDAICIGTEINCLDWMYRKQWLDIIAALRLSYSGTLTYDAVFTVWYEVKGIHDVVFWDALDFIGCSLYVPITRNDNASVSEIMKGWTYNQVGTIKNIVKYLQDISKRYNKQILALEGGYQSVSGGLFNVNDPPNEKKVINNDLQLRGISAYLEVLYKNKGTWLKGISLWQISPVTMTASELTKMWHTQEFTVYKKPAAEVVRRYYTMQE